MSQKNPNSEHWLKQYWRPLIAYQYLAVCIFDFIILPLLTFVLAGFTGNYVPWQPITLKEGGFYHLSMASIIGVSAWTRGQEKITRLIKPKVEEQEQKPTQLNG